MSTLVHWSASGLPELLGAGVSLALLVTAVFRGLRSLSRISDDGAPDASLMDPGRDVERAFAFLEMLLRVSCLPLAVYAGWQLGRLAQEAELATLSLWSGAALHMGSSDQLLGLAPPIVTRVLGQALLPVVSYFLILRPFSYLDRSAFREMREQLPPSGMAQRALFFYCYAAFTLAVAARLGIWLMIYISLSGQPAGAWIFVIGYQIVMRCMWWNDRKKRAGSLGSKNEGASDDQV